MNGNDSANWFTAFVMSHQNDLFFFIVIEKGFTAVLRDQKGELHDQIKLGSFYEIKIVFNEEAPSHFRAKHLVIQYREIPPLAPVRLDSQKNVFITATAEFENYVTEGRITCAKFWNNTFGTFIDVQNIIKNTKQPVEFEFKCKVSPANNLRSIFVPVKVIRYIEKASRRTVSGLVVADSRHHRYVWSKDLNRDAILDDKFCPQDEDIIGRWVEIVVNDVEEVVEPVRILRDFYETRVLNRVAEILVTFEHDGLYQRDKMQFHMFRHSEFGFIADCEHMIPMPLNLRWYRAWIVCHKIEELNSRWRISEKQGEPILLGDLRNDCEHPYFDQRSVSSHNGNSGHQHGPVSRSPSPDRRNFSAHNSHVGSRRNSRSPPRQTYQPEHEFGLKNSDKRRDNDDVVTRTSVVYPNQRPLRKPSNYSETPPVVSKSRDSNSEKAVSETGSSEEFGYSDEENLEPARRREVPTSPSEDSYHISGTNYGDERASRTSTIQMSYEEPKTPSYRSRDPDESTYGTPMANIPNREAAPRPAENRPIDTIDWRQMFHRSCELLEFFMRHSKLARDIKQLDVDQFTEANDLIEFNKNN